MATDAGFLSHCRDLFADLGPLWTGRLFGGTALYIDDAMFAVIFGDTLYMKSAPPLSSAYHDAGSSAFSYETKTGPREIAGLLSMPESALDDPEEALDWARRSLVIAEAAAEVKARKKRSKG
jgi:DNA transformation protein